MQTYRCPRCDDVLLDSFADTSGAQVWFCARCRGTLCERSEVPRWLHGELDFLIEPGEPSPYELTFPEPVLMRRLRCPSDDGWLTVARARQSEDGIRRCETCGLLFLDAGVLPKLRASAQRLRRSSMPVQRAVSVAPPEDGGPAALRMACESVLAVAQAAQERLLADIEPEPVLEGERVGFANPWLDLLALPMALAWMAMVASNGLGRMLLYMVQIQFHEFGHALPAWLSGRAALPLPFGFTFWREERSLFVAMILACAICLLIYRGILERRRFALFTGAALLVLQLVLTFLVPQDTALMLMIAGGIAGEILLSCFVLVAFYFPVLDRLRWDVFRFVLLFPAAGAWLSTCKLWLHVRAGTQPLPMGSILGAAGDGSGDLERLVSHYDFTPESITRLYVTLVWLSGLALIGTYGTFALRALASLRRPAPQQPSVRSTDHS